MKLGSLISKDFIITGNSCKSIMEAVETLTKHFEKQVKLPCSIEDVKKVVLEREQLGGTILPPGIAIPHGRIEGFEDILAGIWVPDKPLVTDDGDVKILFFFITSKSGSPLYLPVLSCLGTYFGDEEFLDSLMGQSPAQIHEKLKTMELKKEITVEDIMTPDPVCCTQEMSLAQLADILYQKKLSYLPVIDEAGNQVGEVTIKDLLSKGVPDYVKRLGNVSFMRSLEPFEALLRDEDRIKIKEIMRPSNRGITKGSSILEAVILMTTKGYRHIPVLDGKKPVGMISETDILQKVIRG